MFRTAVIRLLSSMLGTRPLDGLKVQALSDNCIPATGRGNRVPYYFAECVRLLCEVLYLGLSSVVDVVTVQRTLRLKAGKERSLPLLRPMSGCGR